MGPRTVFCISTDEAQAMELVNQLKLAGFANDDICALLPDKTGLKDFGYERHTKAPEGALAGGATGLLLGAAVGWLSWLGVLPLHSLQPLITAGVGVVTLGCAALGTLVGGMLGSCLGLARPEYEARRYEGKLPGDNILISVSCPSARAARWARHIFHTGGASDIATGSATRCLPAHPAPLSSTPHVG